MKRKTRQSKRKPRKTNDLDDDYEENTKTSPVRRSPRKTKPTEKILASRALEGISNDTSSPSSTPEKRTNRSQFKSPEKRAKRPKTESISPASKSASVPRASLKGSNGMLKNFRQNKHNSVFVVHGRRIELGNYPQNPELYVLCRDWCKSGSPKIEVADDSEKKVQWTQFPTRRVVVSSYKEVESRMEKVLGSMEEYATQELLMEHVNHGKEIRQRSQEEYSKMLQTAENDIFEFWKNGMFGMENVRYCE